MSDDEVQLAMSVPEFCRRHGIGMTLYFKLKGLGLGPREMRILSEDGNIKKILISHGAAAEWRREREQ